MVLALRIHRLPGRAQIQRWLPIAFAWLLLAGTMAGIAWSYFGDGEPSPYGLCYESRGRPIPCELKKR